MLTQEDAAYYKIGSLYDVWNNRRRMEGSPSVSPAPGNAMPPGALGVPGEPDLAAV